MKSVFSKVSILTSFLIFTIFGITFGQPKSNVINPAWSYDKMIYEVNLRQFTQSGSIREFREHLPRLKELGVGILWFMPLHPIGEVNRKGAMGSYYSVKDYKGLDPYYGTPQEFKELVQEIHKMGMYIIIDWVANHTSWDNPLVKSNPEFYTKDSLGKFVPPVADWADVIDLNYENTALREYMTGALEFWVKEYNIDGFRCDVAGMVPVDFWNSAVARLNKIKPVFMLAEWEGAVMHENAFNMSYGWDLHQALNKVAKGEAKPSALIEIIENNLKTYPKNAMRMQFITNHDENSWNGTEFERMGDAVEAMAVFTYTVPGMPLLYTGQEAGFDKRLNFFEKDQVDWKESKFFPFYNKLNDLKKNNPVLHNGEAGGDFNIIKNDQDDKVVSFSRDLKDNTIICVFNMSKNISTANLKINNAGNYIDYFSDQKLTFKKNEKIDLKPWDYRVFIKQN